MVNSMSVLALGATAMMSLAAPQKDDSNILSEAYSRGEIAVDLCGLAGDNFAEFEKALANDPNFAEENSTQDYRVYVADEPVLRILVIARERETAFPMAYCRTFHPNPDGTTRFERNMHCEGDKADCDAVFMEFYRHDEQILGS